MSAFKWKEVYFRNSRGLKLAGLYYTRGKAGSATLIVCHGFKGSKEGGGKACQMAEYFATQADYDTLLFDFSGNGKSEGNFENITLSGQIDDLNCAIDWCKEQGASTIVTMGRSFGGTTAICQAALDTRVSGVCTLAAPARLVKRFSELMDEDPDDPDKYILPGDEGILYINKTYFEDIAKYDVPLLASQIAPRSLLIIQGTKDDLIPQEDARLINEAANEPKELIFIEGANHQFENYYDQVWDICLRWLKTFKE